MKNKPLVLFGLDYLLSKLDELLKRLSRYRKHGAVVKLSFKTNLLGEFRFVEVTFEDKHAVTFMLDAYNCWQKYKKGGK